jgi:hypothetical protein
MALLPNLGVRFNFWHFSEALALSSKYSMYSPREALASLAPPVTTHHEGKIKREVTPIGENFTFLDLEQNCRFMDGH